MTPRQVLKLMKAIAENNNVDLKIKIDKHYTTDTVFLSHANWSRISDFKCFQCDSWHPEDKHLRVYARSVAEAMVVLGHELGHVITASLYRCSRDNNEVVLRYEKRASSWALRFFKHNGLKKVYRRYARLALNDVYNSYKNLPMKYY